MVADLQLVQRMAAQEAQEARRGSIGAEAAPSPRACGVAGFCWGAWPALVAAADGLAKAVVMAHPSHRKLMENFHTERGDPSSVFEATACPILLMPCGNDDPRDKAGGESEAALKRSAQAGSCVVTEFGKMTHGFILRGDVADPAVAAEVTTAVAHMASFFTRHLQAAPG